MTKLDFISLADSVKTSSVKFTDSHIRVLADFCQSQNPSFKRDRWVAYIKGECGPNGGTIIKTTKNAGSCNSEDEEDIRKYESNPTRHYCPKVEGHAGYCHCHICGELKYPVSGEDRERIIHKHIIKQRFPPTK